ncbi:MAG: CvpA family protein [Ignavibacteriae bacterium]|nr:CvpA family protein [Ignavibacteriota bacterium]
MNYIDYILIVIIFIGFILGYKDGLVRKLIGLLGLILGIYLAISYADVIGEKLAPIFNDETYLAKMIGGLVIFLGTILFASIIKRLVHPVDKVNKFINQLLGGITGTIQIIFFVSVFLLLLNVLNVPKQNDKDNSLLYSSIYNVTPTIIDLIIGSNFKTEGFLKDYINSKNDKEIPEDFSEPIDLDTLNSKNDK